MLNFADVNKTDQIHQGYLNHVKSKQGNTISNAYIVRRTTLYVNNTIK